jgi:hypothetical protein
MITLGYTTNWTDRQGKIIISLWWKIVKKTGQNGCGDTVEKGVYNSMNLALFTYGGQNPVRMFDPDGTTSLDVGDERMYANLAAADYNNTQAVGSYYWNVYVDPKASNIKTVDNRKYMRVKGSHLELRLDKNN